MINCRIMRLKRTIFRMRIALRRLVVSSFETISMTWMKILFIDLFQAMEAKLIMEEFSELFHNDRHECGRQKNSTSPPSFMQRVAKWIVTNDIGSYFTLVTPASWHWIWKNSIVDFKKRVAFSSFLVFSHTGQRSERERVKSRDGEPYLELYSQY